MTGVGLTWELDVWAPRIKVLTAAARMGALEPGAPLDDAAFDECVFASLDVLPVPVVQVPMEEAVVTVDLGRVGDALARLVAAGRVRRLDCVDRAMFMRLGGGLGL